MDNTLGKQIVRNIAANYLSVIINMVSAIFVTRMLLKGLGPDFYGFWSLLWNVFMYALILDFGVGVTVQKYTAEVHISGDYEKLNRIVSTVFVFYLLTMLVIVGAAGALTPILDRIFVLEPREQIGYYKTAFLVFALGNGLVFPMGIFSEIVGGIRRYDIDNIVVSGSIIIRIFGIWLIFQLGGSLLELAVFVNGLNFLVQVVLYLYVKEKIPRFRIQLKHFTWRNIKEISEFSLFAYVVSIAELITYNADRLVLGIFVGTSSIAIYQIGTRLPDIMRILSSGFSGSISSIAASLHYSGEKTRLNNIVFASFRFGIFVGSIMYIEFMLLGPQILYVWLDHTNPKTIMTCYVMLTSMFAAILMEKNAKKILQMGGRHRLISIATAVESLLNLGISIALVRKYGAVGVALGTLIPNVLFGLFVYLPAMAAYTEVRVWKFIKQVYLAILYPVVPTAAILYAASRFIALESWNIMVLAAVGIGTGLLYLVLGWMLYIRKEEKVQLREQLPQSLVKKLSWLF